MSKKQSLSSVGPQPERLTPAIPGADPHGAWVERLGPADYSPQGTTDTVRLLGDGLAALDLRAGDRVVFARGRLPAFGDLAVLREGPEGPLSLWKVYPEGDQLNLSDGVARHAAAEGTRVEGVVLAVQRGFAGAAD